MYAMYVMYVHTSIYTSIFIYIYIYFTYTLTYIHQHVIYIYIYIYIYICMYKKHTYRYSHLVHWNRTTSCSNSPQAASTGCGRGRNHGSSAMQRRRRLPWLELSEVGPKSSIELDHELQKKNPAARGLILGIINTNLTFVLKTMI